jgi:diacylglycerol kinase family enzyme
MEALTRFRAVPLTVRLDGVAASAYGMWIPPDGDASARPAALRVEPRDGARVISGHAIQFAAVVTPVFGGASNLRLPNVEMRDGLLDFLFIEALGPDHLSQLRARLEHWMHHGHEAPTPPEPTTPPDPTEVLALDLPGVWRFQARGATILRPAAMDVTLDGEIRARTPTVVRVAPDALRVLAPTES